MEDIPKVKSESKRGSGSVDKTAANIESTPVDRWTIGKNSRMQGKKSAGHIGASNINAG